MDQLLVSLPTAVDLLVGDPQFIGERVGVADGIGSLAAYLVFGAELGAGNLTFGLETDPFDLPDPPLGIG